jgi:hypothetical protein
VFPKDLAKRLAPKGELQHELFVPRPWESYVDCEACYLVEGIPDTFTYWTFGKPAIGAFNCGSVDRELFQHELLTFLAATHPKKLIIVPDPDAFWRWHDALSVVLAEITIEWIDVSLWHTEPTKIDSNALLQACDNRRIPFFQALEWCHRNSNPYQRSIGESIIEKRIDGYFRIDEGIPPQRLTNFVLHIRHFARDAETQEGRVDVTFQFAFGRKRVTKVVETKTLGDVKKSLELIASLTHTLFVKDAKSTLKTIGFFEEGNYQYPGEVQSFEKFGHIAPNLELFGNVAVYNGKAFPANHNGIVALPDKVVCTMSPDAPVMTLTSEPGTNQKLVSTLYAAYGLNGVLSLAFDLASVRMAAIVDRFGNHALKYLHGEHGIGKTKLETLVKTLFGMSAARNGYRSLTGKDTRASLERVAQKYQYLPISLHEWKPEHEDATDFLEKAYDRCIKNRAETDNSTRVKNNALSAFMTITSNYVPTPKAALHTRSAYLSFQKSSFHKEHLNTLETLVETSDIVLRAYLARIDIDDLHAKARTAIQKHSDDARAVNNYAPFLVGLAILNAIEALSNADYKRYCQEFLDVTLPATLTTITEDSLVDDFLQELAQKAMHITQRIGTDDWETEINPGTHYIIREKNHAVYLILDVPACVSVVNKGNRAQFDKKVLQQALRDSPYFFQQPTRTKIDNTTKYKAVWLNIDTIETRLHLTFRASTEEMPTNLTLTNAGVE